MVFILFKATTVVFLLSAAMSQPGEANMFQKCKADPVVVARQEQAGLQFELVSVPRVCVDDSDPGDIYDQAARLRVTNVSGSPISVIFEGGATGHLAFGVADYAPVLMPDRVKRITFGPLNPAKRRQDRLDLAPDESGIIPGRSSYVLQIINTARRDMAVLGKKSDDSVVVDYRVNYSYRVRNDLGQVVEGSFSQPVAIWLRQ